MTKRYATKSTEPLHQLTVRIPKSLNAHLEAFALVTNRTFRSVAEAAISDYLRRAKLSPVQMRKLRALLDE